MKKKCDDKLLICNKNCTCRPMYPYEIMSMCSLFICVVYFSGGNR